MEMLDGLSEDSGAAGPEAVYDRIASMSCKAAVKGNSRLSEQEADRLIDELLGLKIPMPVPTDGPPSFPSANMKWKRNLRGSCDETAFNHTDRAHGAGKDGAFCGSWPNASAVRSSAPIPCRSTAIWTWALPR